MKNLNKYVLMMVMLVFFTINGAYAQNNKIDQLKQQQKEIEDNLSKTKTLLNETSKKAKMSLTDLSLLKNQIEHRKNLINSYTSEIVEIDGEIENKSGEVTQLQKNLKQLKAEYAQLIKQSYKSRNSYNKWMFVFASKDFYQAIKRIKYMMEFSKYRKKRAMMIQGTATKISNQIAQLGTQKEKKEVVVQVKEKEAKELEKDKKQKEVTVSKLKSREKELKADLAKQKKDMDRLNSEINRIIREEIAKKEREAAELARKKAEEIAKANPKTTKPNETSASPGNEKANATNNTNASNTQPKPKIEPAPADVKLSNDFILNQGKLPWPTDNGAVVRRFGKQAHEELSGVTWDNHGIDFGCNSGAIARAVFAGKVSRILNMPGGYAVLIQHGTYYTVYNYLSVVNVKEGQMVETKQKIGTVAVDPLRQETVLHFELWKGQTIQNPEVWLRR